MIVSVALLVWVQLLCSGLAAACLNMYQLGTVDIGNFTLIYCMDMHAETLYSGYHDMITAT